MLASEIIHEALIYGVEKPCGCGGKSYVACIMSYFPPNVLEERLERTFREMMRFRICTSCGKADHLEGTQEEDDTRKLEPKLISVESYGHINDSWQVSFTKPNGRL